MLTNDVRMMFAIYFGEGYWDTTVDSAPLGTNDEEKWSIIVSNLSDHISPAVMIDEILS